MGAKLRKIERILGGPKFAVVIIVIFSLFMIVGTFVESYHGVDFAGRLIYKNWPFILVQVCMLVSICFAAFLRLPPRKRLYGFYAIHAGLVLIGLGSLITFISGIDGTLFLPQGQPVRRVNLNRDLLKVFQEGKETYRIYRLPYAAFQQRLSVSGEHFSLGRYLPFAEKEFVWALPTKEYPKTSSLHSSEYSLANGNLSETLFFSLHPEQEEFPSTLNLGPLKIHYLPAALAPCFTLPNPSGYILWNETRGECTTPEEENIPVAETASGKKFFVLNPGGEPLHFFPDLSPRPMDLDGKIIPAQPWRTFSKNLFTQSPTLFLFGHSLAHYDKDQQSWVKKDFPSGDTLPLPWMGFEIRLLRHSDSQVPRYRPVASLPIQQKGELIRGGLRALEVEAGGQSFWATSERPLTLMIGPKRTTFVLDKEALTLPYEFVLSRFEMDKDPGTDNPASYESFVSLFTGEGHREAHIYMNNPLVQGDLTFYQASYSQDQEGNYASTLSVNMDKGRPLKYIGSLLVVLGAFAHYLLNRRKKKSKHRELVALGKYAV